MHGQGQSGVRAQRDMGKKTASIGESNRRFSILIINPNTSSAMTDGLKPVLDRLQYPDIEFDYFTAPPEPVTLPSGRVIDGVPSINSGEDSVQSAVHCQPSLVPLVPKYDAFLVACYSAHPLVGILKDEIEKFEDAVSSAESPRKYVTGIFDASITASLSLVSSFGLAAEGQGSRKSPAKDSFGIVSTGSIWKTELSQAVKDMLLNSGDDSTAIPRFAGVETTGLSAVELHTTPPDEVRKRMIDATKRLITGTPRPVSAICMGCAGMAGMEEAVREGCIQAYGVHRGQRVRIVDGVVAGAGMLIAACKARF